MNLIQRVKKVRSCVYVIIPNIISDSNYWLLEIPIKINVFFIHVIYKYELNLKESGKK